MKLLSFQLKNIRCFEDVGNIKMDPKINVFVGRNNSGKTTVLSSILSLQAGFGMDGGNMRSNSQNLSFMMFRLREPAGLHPSEVKISQNGGEKSFWCAYQAQHPFDKLGDQQFGVGSHVFSNSRGSSVFEPFIAKRKAVAFDETINSSVSSTVTGTLRHLYSRIDEIAVSGHPQNEKFRRALKDSLGLEITTRSSPNGKVAGIYFGSDAETFVPMDRMGDGVSEIVALIVELCIAKNKIFVLEEPETNLHPAGIKALMRLVLEASERNQFIVSTHSNIVVRELGHQEETKIFRVFKAGDLPSSPSLIETVDNDPQSRQQLLRELGYEFSDYDLFSGWLFLEESSAETIFNQILIPEFAPKLIGKLRTYSAGGVTKVQASLEDFKRLMVFVQLSEVYKGKTFVQVDGDPAGLEVLQKLRDTFQSMDQKKLSHFEKEQFEHYYPSSFESQVQTALAIPDNSLRRKAKENLLKEVVAWTKNNRAVARTEWEASAAEPIKLLNAITTAIL